MISEDKFGFTLLEFIIYSGVITMVLAALILIGVNVLNAKTKIFAMEEVIHNAKFTLEKITKEIRTAQAIVNATSSYLELIDSDGDTVEFKLEDGIIKTRRGGAISEFIPLTTNSVVVSTLNSLTLLIHKHLVRLE